MKMSGETHSVTQTVFKRYYTQLLSYPGPHLKRGWGRERQRVGGDVTGTRHRWKGCVMALGGGGMDAPGELYPYPNCHAHVDRAATHL